MPKITIHNVDAILMRIMRAEGKLKEDLLRQYKTAIDTTGVDLVRSATEFLNKPSWELSASIRASQVKEYTRRKVLFLAVDPGDTKNPKPNTPGDYAWYHEHGYTITASKVKNPKSGRLVRGGTKRAAYRKTEPKWFFKQAAEALLPKLRSDIDEINANTKLQLK